MPRSRGGNKVVSWQARKKKKRNESKSNRVTEREKYMREDDEKENKGHES